MFMIARARYERREQQSPVSLNPQPSMEADLQSAQQADPEYPETGAPAGREPVGLSIDDLRPVGCADSRQEPAMETGERKMED